MRIQEVILENVLALAREDFSDTIIAAGIAQRWLGMLDAKARILCQFHWFRRKYIWSKN